MKILVTGGAGYIGSILVPLLLNKDNEVVVIDNFRYQQTSLLDYCYNENLTIIRGDCRNKELIENLIKKVDIVIPLACLVGAPICNRYPEDAKTINYDSIKMILDFMSKDQKMIFPSTNSGYGIGKNDVYCTEENALNPISLYGRLKVGIEKIILDRGNSISFRLATVFGVSPRMRLDLLVNDFTYKAYKEGVLVLFESHFKRNYLHIRDVAKAFIHCLDNFHNMEGNAYNIGLSDANLSKLELSNVIKKHIPNLVIIESEIGQDIDKRDYIVSNEKVERTGYYPDFSLDMGIKELIKCFQIIDYNLFGNI